MRYIGVDPGKAGALALLTEQGQAVAHTLMPVVEAKKGGRVEYDIPAIRLWLALALDRAHDEGHAVHAFCERMQPLPPKLARGPAGGGITNFQRGAARYLFEGLFSGLSIPYTLVVPALWQRSMHEGTSGSDTKQRSIIAAQRLFPYVDLRRSERARKPHDGIAEALLIAEFGRRLVSATAAVKDATRG